MRIGRAFGAAVLAAGILAFLPGPCFAEEAGAFDVVAYAALFDAVIADMGDLISATAKSATVKDAFAIAKQRLGAGDIAFVLDTGRQGILQGAAFSVDKEGGLHLNVGMGLLDAYKKRPSDVFCVLIHEMRHIYDFFIHHDGYLASFSDEKESYWYDLDAIHVEAQFIEECVRNTYRLSRFEQFVLTSWQRDNLDMASTILRQKSMRVFFFFNDLEKRWMEDPASKPAVLADAVAFGKDALAAYSALKDSETQPKYSLYIVLKSWDADFTRLIKIMEAERKMTWDGYFAEEKAVGDIIRKVDRVLERDRTDRMAYVSSLMESWERDLAESGQGG